MNTPTVAAPAPSVAPVSYEVRALYLYELVCTGRHPGLRAAPQPTRVGS
jgi:hypothetical protein